MLMFRHFVVVSVSAALAEIALGIATNSTPSFALSKELAEVSPTLTKLTQAEYALPNARPGVDKRISLTAQQNKLSIEDNSYKADRKQTNTQAQAKPLKPTVLQNREPDPLVPSYLQPNPNPLQFPTRPEEVDIETTQPLTLQQALELARRNNRDLQVVILQLERSRQALKEQRAALYPTLNFQADATNTRSASGALNRQAAQNAGQTVTGRGDSFALTGTVQLDYDIYTGGRRSSQILAAEEQVRNSQLEVERLSEQTRLDVTNAYYDVQQADEQIRISESAVRAAQQSLRDAVALEQAGLGTRFDTLQAQVQLANENQNLTTARANQRTNRRELARLLSLPQSIDIVTADPVEVAGLWPLSLEESIVQAFQNRAELQQQLAQRNISEYQRRVAVAEQRPQVSLFGNINLLDVFNDGLGLSNGYQLGARLQWNLFNGGASKARANQQSANIAIAETQFANTRNQIRFQVEQAYNNLQSNFQNIQTASVALEQAREALRLARLRFQAGVGTQTDVINSENQLTTAEGNRVNAILNYNRALATLQRAISNLGSTNAPTVPTP